MLFPHKVPFEIKALTSRLNKIDKTNKPYILEVVKSVIAAIEGSTFLQSDWRNLETQLIQDDLDTVTCGIYCLLKTAFSIPTQALDYQNLAQELQEIRIPADYIPDLCKTISNYRSTAAMPDHVRMPSVTLPTLASFRWRTDVTISTSVLSKVLECTVLMEMNLSNGRTYTIEVPVSKFHLLRYSVARVLREMEEMQTRSVKSIET